MAPDISISACFRCTRTEFDWNPVGDSLKTAGLNGPSFGSHRLTAAARRVPAWYNYGGVCRPRLGYMCFKCLDQQHHTRHRNAVATLHRQLHAVLLQISISYIYDFVFPSSHKQWRLLNRHNYMQRKRTLLLFLGGAPGSNNWIYDLHKQLQHQRTGGAIRKGRTYYSSSVVDRSDLYTILCEFLI